LPLGYLTSPPVIARAGWNVSTVGSLRPAKRNGADVRLTPIRNGGGNAITTGAGTNFTANAVVISLDMSVTTVVN